MFPYNKGKLPHTKRQPFPLEKYQFCPAVLAMVIFFTSKLV